MGPYWIQKICGEQLVIGNIRLWLNFKESSPHYDEDYDLRDQNRFDEEEKEEMVSNFINLLKANQQPKTIGLLLEENIIEIEPFQRDIYIYLVVLHKSENVYETVNEFFMVRKHLIS